ncbi:MAG: hypothetical protein K0R51_2393 [Cytophagaceae bacterium]|jgi:hypothetical protein|nr:hypothetical protein [Cytophagaceae bacterium]
MKTAIISIVFIFIYSAGLYLWLKKADFRLSLKASRYMKGLHYFFLVLTVFSVLIHYSLDLDLRGIWTNRLIVFSLITTGILFYPFAPKKSVSRPEKIYFGLFTGLPIVIAGILLVPFVGTIIVLSIWGQLTCPVSKIHYEDQNLRIQSSFSEFLGPSRLDIIEKKGLFEKSHYQSITHDTHFDSLKVSYDADATRVIFKSTNKFVQPEQIVVIDHLP